MQERINVMISSTAKDLPEHRQQVIEACQRVGMFPLPMEHLPADLTAADREGRPFHLLEDGRALTELF